MDAQMALGDTESHSEIETVLDDNQSSFRVQSLGGPRHANLEVQGGEARMLNWRGRKTPRVRWWSQGLLRSFKSSGDIKSRKYSTRDNPKFVESEMQPRIKYLQTVLLCRCFTSHWTLYYFQMNPSLLASSLSGLFISSTASWYPCSA